jgi:hypothetical protein
MKKKPMFGKMAPKNKGAMEHKMASGKIMKGPPMKKDKKKKMGY